MRLPRVAVLALLVACALPVSAQSTVYSENFDGVTAGTFPPGWTADAPTGTPATGWAVDDTLDASGGTYPPTPYFGWNWFCYIIGPTPVSTINSLPYALNFNNGLGLSSGTLASGSATSPLITLTTTAGVTLTFADWFECMSCDTDAATSGSFGVDQRFVEIVDSGGVTVLSIQLVVDADGDGVAPYTATSPLIDGACSESEDMHIHTVALSSLPPGDYRIRFRFNQAIEFDYAGVFPTTPPFGEDDMQGWFVDDVAINCPLPDLTPPSSVTQLTPASGATVISPVLFDWTDATDTGACGPGTVTYDLLIDDLATVPNPDYTQAGLSLSTATQVLPAGSYAWSVRVVDGGGNTATAGPIPFDVEINLPPSAPDSLFVNESADSAQNGDPGFVSPVVDETPNFSAVYRDPNITPDTAIGLRFQVSADPTFTILDFDSGPIGISPPLPEDTRTPDLTINVNLLRNTVYFWRIQFTDAGGLTGAWSIAQSFRIGDDFEFGVRKGSSHHGRRCWVATAAWGSEAAPAVESLQAWRFGTMQTASAGQVASRAYHVVGASASESFQGSFPVRFASGFAAGPGLAIAAALAAGLCLAGLIRLVRPL